MLRHTAFFLFREDTTPEQHLAMLKGLAYMRFASPSVRALDFGSDLLGGSTPLREVKPWDRSPLWRSRGTGPVFNYDVALHLDFDDQAGLDAYNDCDVHHEVGVYNASIARGEFTARVDWWYDGGPLIAKDKVKHSAMFIWRDDVDEAGRDEVLASLKELELAPKVERVTVGTNVGTLKTDYDFIVDVQVPDKAAAEELVASKEYARVLEGVGKATQYEWTARLTHLMHGM
jgi:hypothetical protein